MAETAVERHDRMMRAEMEQGDRARATAEKPEDFWRGRVPHFRAHSGEGPEVDPTPAALARLIDAGARAIDVGAGGGRIAIPLAGHCRELVAVEPSAAMRQVLEEEIARHAVANIRVVAATWEAAEVDPAELVFAAHVTYSVPSIEPFIRKLDAKATRHAALVALTDSPQSPFAAFWRVVHGEERLRLPCRDELIAVIRELGDDPEVIPLGPVPVPALGTPAEAVETLRFRLFVEAGTPADDRLQAALADLAEERDGQLWPKLARPNERSIIRWTPGRLHSAG